jgi:hypothetical protein
LYENLAAAVMLGSAVTLAGIWISLRRRPGRWSKILAESFWRRCVGWTLTLTVAAIIGVAAGGGTLLVPVLVVGASCLVFTVTMWIDAR